MQEAIDELLSENKEIAKRLYDAAPEKGMSWERHGVGGIKHGA